MSRRQVAELADRLGHVEQLLDKVDRSIERIEIVTVVREPASALSADAYNGLRKQVAAAAGERMAHLSQLAQFDAALRAGASADELAVLCREWMGQAALEVVVDPWLDDAFEVVGPGDATGRLVVRPAYVDRVTGRVVRSGVAERVPVEEPPTGVVAGAPSGDGSAVAEGEATS